VSEEARKPEYPPLSLHPFVGLELGERWGREVGELSQRLTNVDQAVFRLETKTEALDVKFEAKIDALEAKVDAKIDALEAKVDAKIDALEAKVDAKIDALEARVNAKIDALEAKFDAKFDALEARLNALEVKVAELAHIVARHYERFSSQEKRLDSNAKLLWGMFTAILAAIIIQKFL